MKKFTKKDQKLLALWAADCAEHVLPYFEKEFPKDDRPRKAIEACRIWVRTGIFKMANVRVIRWQHMRRLVWRQRIARLALPLAPQARQWQPRM